MAGKFFLSLFKKGDQMKKYVALLAVLSVCLIAWSPRPNHNRPKSVMVSPNGLSVIPLRFETGVLNNAAQSKVLTGLNDKNYSHIMVWNNTTDKLAFVTSEVGNEAPSSTIDQKMYVASSGTATFDDISIFSNLYLKTEAGTSTVSGTVDITIW